MKKKGSIFRRWWFWILIVIVVVLIIIFFYPKQCGGLISKSSETYRACSCLGVLKQVCLHPDFIDVPKGSALCLDSAPTNLCYGLCMCNKNNCDLLYNQIDNEIKSLNYCNIDSDCKDIPLGGGYIAFGCYHYVNINTDEKKIYSEMDNYWDKCGQIIDECGSSPPAKCVNGKCVSSQ
jgi:hypothetical protein